MKMDSTWFSIDFRPTFQEWTEANKLFEKDLYHQDSETFAVNPSKSINDPQAQSKNSIPQENQSCDSTQTPRKQPIDTVNYQKNICSYISKKIVQHLLNPKSEKLVRKLCQKTQCKYQDAIKYYTKRYKEKFGINHLAMLITPQHEEQINIKKMFCVFLNWFLRNKYMFYMLKYGKMQEKQKYIQFKNKYILYIVDVQQKFSKYL